MKKIIAFFWIYCISSFIGSVIETIWCYIRNKRIESRTSLIYEYSIPIYGISAVLLLLVVYGFGLDKWYQLFLFGFLISSVVEYVSSFIQEKVFKSESWNYKDFKYNLNGRVNLLYSCLFGIISLVLYYLVLNPLYTFYMSLNYSQVFLLITVCLFVFMLFDYSVSFLAAIRWQERKNNIKRDGIHWQIIDKKYNDKRMKKIYPNAIYLDK